MSSFYNARYLPSGETLRSQYRVPARVLLDGSSTVRALFDLALRSRRVGNCLDVKTVGSLALCVEISEDYLGVKLE